MLEIILFLSIAVLILLFFYKQSVVPEYKLNQLSYNSLDQLPELMAEKSPIIILDTPSASFWTASDIVTRPVLIEQGAPLLALCQQNNKSHQAYKSSLASFFGEYSGTPVWVKTKWLPVLTNPWLQWLTMPESKAWLGSRGLQATYAPWTLITASEGEAFISLLHKKHDTYLPSSWKNRLPSDFTRADTPFLSDIKYIDVILREGTSLLVPAHWKVAYQTAPEIPAGKPVFIVETAFHHPLSRIVEKITEGS
jgi:hypothetical protein